MSALALAMMLTGAGAVQPRPERPTPIGSVPVPPDRVSLPSPPPPAPPRATPPRRARSNFHSYFSVDDYPAQALRERAEGTTGVRLTVDAGGRVAECRVTALSGSASLDAATCRILSRRARYSPARDIDGNPVAGVDQARITWRLPQADPAPGGRARIPLPAIRAVLRGQVQDLFAARDYPAEAQQARQAGQTIVRLVVGTSGRVIACDVAATSRSAALDAAACRILKRRARYTPARDARGAPACDVFWGPVEWVLPPLPRRLPHAAPASAPPPIERQLAAGACPGRAP
jgi:TonB family protein